MTASPLTGALNTRGSDFRPIGGYISETVINRGTFSIEDEYKVVCALSNSAAFNDLEWPRTPVSRSQHTCSLKANISQTVHLIHPMFGYVFGVGGVCRGACTKQVKQRWKWLRGSFSGQQLVLYLALLSCSLCTVKLHNCTIVWANKEGRKEWRYFQLDQIQTRRVGKTWYFLALCVNITKTVRDKSKVTIND